MDEFLDLSVCFRAVITFKVESVKQTDIFP